MTNTITQKLTRAAVIAALYTALTLLLAPISFSATQFRAAEALTVLPFLFPEAVWGLTVGCLLGNLLGGAHILDVIVGPLATLAAALLTARCRRKPLAVLPPVVVNAVVVGAVIAYTSAPDAFWAAFPPIMLSVGLGQAGVCFALGLPLLYGAEKLLGRLTHGENA